MPRLSTAEINGLLQSEHWRDHIELLKKLPDDVDAPLAARCLLHILETNDFYFARNLRKRMPDPVIGEVVTQLRAQLDSLEGRFAERAIILVERIRLSREEEGQAEAWQAALQLMLDVDTTYGWGSKQRKAKLRGLSEDASAVGTLQAVAVASETPRMDVLVVLALEGSDESMDALLPHFAVSDFGQRLERLERLRTHIARDGTRADQLLCEAEQQLAEHRTESPALDFAEQLGLGKRKTFWFQYDLGTHERSPNGLNPKFRCMIMIDSRTNSWFRVSVYEIEEHRRTQFGGEKVVDELALGACEAQALPAWLASVAPRLQCTWGASHISSGLRGKKRQALVDWLESQLR